MRGNRSGTGASGAPTPGGPAFGGATAGNKPPAAKTRTVYVLDKGKPTPRQVVVGISDSYSTEIKSGLNEGDVVITGLDLSKGGAKTATTGAPPMGGFR